MLLIVGNLVVWVNEHDALFVDGNKENVGELGLRSLLWEREREKEGERERKREREKEGERERKREREG